MKTHNKEKDNLLDEEMKNKSMNDKMVKMIVKGITPEDLVEWCEKNQQEVENQRRWLEEHTIKIDTCNGNSIQSENVEVIECQISQSLKLSLEELGEKLSSIINRFEGLKNQVDKMLKCFDKDE